MSSTRKPSRTDWDRVDSLTDEEIDTSEVPPLDEQFFSEPSCGCRPTRRRSRSASIRTVLEWFKAQGKGYQTRINTILRKYMEAQRK